MQAHPDIIRTLASLHERCSALESHLLNSETHLGFRKDEKISIFSSGDVTFDVQHWKNAGLANVGGYEIRYRPDTNMKRLKISKIKGGQETFTGYYMTKISPGFITSAHFAFVDERGRELVKLIGHPISLEPKEEAQLLALIQGQ